MKRYTNFIFAICIIAILVTCLSPYSGKYENTTGLPVEGTPVVVSHLFEPLGGGGVGGIKFYTTDPKYRTQSGYTLWAYNSAPSGVFIERTVRLSKPTGDNLAGYGVIICSGQQEIDGKSEIVFLTIMINNNGQYAVGKVTGGSYKPLVPWKTHSALIGSGLINKIKIVRDNTLGSENQYFLHFNDVHYPASDFFVDNEAPLCEGYGRNGYIVVISPTDLNGSAVEVYFYE